MARFLDIFRPDDYVERVTDIDCAELKAQGVELLILDLDNTLVPWKSSAVPEEVKGWVRGAESVGLKLAILSNTHYPGRLSRIASELGVPSIPHALKPWRFGFRKAARLAQCEFCSAVVVGDQLLTDVVGGKRAGMRTILVKPMSAHEFIGTRISRLLERGILSLLRLTPRQGTKSVQSQSQTRDTT